MMSIKEAAERIARSSLTIAFTGAGISAESGIPTFRGSGGLWENYRIEDVASPEGFKRNPKLVWEFYLERRRKIKRAKPNPAHYALAELEKTLESFGKEFWIITQNIDNLHREAGNEKIIELHGNIWYSRCTNPRCKNSVPFYDPRTTFPELPPRCHLCGSIIRPHVVWFGEPLPERELEKAFNLSKRAEVVIVVGTSGVVFPAAYIPYYVKEGGGYVIEVNLEESGITRIADCFLRGKAGEVLPELVKEVRGILQ